METTLNKILEHDPCGQNNGATEGFGLLIKNLGIGGCNDRPVTIMQILESNGIADAVWALRCFDYKDYCLFLDDVGKVTSHKSKPLTAASAYYVTHASADAAYASAPDAVSGRKAKWKEIETLFKKRFA